MINKHHKMFQYNDIQLISRKPTTELCEIMYRNYSDKSSLHKHHNYSLIYDEMFSELRNRKINILEIGIGSVNTPTIKYNNSLRFLQHEEVYFNENNCNVLCTIFWIS